MDTSTSRGVAETPTPGRYARQLVSHTWTAATPTAQLRVAGGRS